MFETLKKADAKASGFDSFLATILAEHDAAGARAQMKTLWIGYVRALLQEDKQAPVQSRAGGSGGPLGVGVFEPGPIPHQIARGRRWAGGQAETSHAHVVDC